MAFYPIEDIEVTTSEKAMSVKYNKLCENSVNSTDDIHPQYNLMPIKYHGETLKQTITRHFDGPNLLWIAIKSSCQGMTFTSIANLRDYISSDLTAGRAGIQHSTKLSKVYTAVKVSFTRICTASVSAQQVNFTVIKPSGVGISQSQAITNTSVDGSLSQDISDVPAGATIRVILNISCLNFNDNDVSTISNVIIELI